MKSGRPKDKPKEQVKAMITSPIRILLKRLADKNHRNVSQQIAAMTEETAKKEGVE